jgi:5-methylcytosine-specific restriction enzyme subunit McrC
VDDLRDGLRITARAWVGFVRFPTFDISIRPKLAGDNLGLVDLIAFASGLDALRPNDAVRTLDACGAGLLDLIGRLLVDASDRLLRQGLRSDYVTHEEPLSVVRGRLLADKQMLRRFGLIDQLECRFDEHEGNIVDNQILAATLSTLARRADDLRLRRDAGVLTAEFLELCDPASLDLSAARAEITYDRLNQQYRAAHELSWLLLDGLGIDDIHAQGRTDSFAFLIDMDVLFERFVLNLLVASLDAGSYRVTYQGATSTIIREFATGRPYTSIRPDVVVTRRADGTRLPVDAKYKTYDERRVSADDIAQAFLYGYAFGSASSARALILYPASGTGRLLDLEIRTLDLLTAAQITAVGVHIPTVLAQLRLPEAGSALAAIRAQFA